MHWKVSSAIIRVSLLAPRSLRLAIRFASRYRAPLVDSTRGGHLKCLYLTNRVVRLFVLIRLHCFRVTCSQRDGGQCSRTCGQSVLITRIVFGSTTRAPLCMTHGGDTGKDYDDCRRVALRSLPMNHGITPSLHRGGERGEATFQSYNPSEWWKKELEMREK